MKTFKLQRFKYFLPFTLFLWGTAFIFFMVALLPTQQRIATGPTPVEEIDFSGDIDKIYATVKLDAIYDWYCQREDDGKVMGKEYIIITHDKYIMGLYALNDDIASAEKLLAATTAYLEGDDDGTLLADAQYETTVFIEKIRAASIGYYNDYASQYSEETQARFLPYYMKTYDPVGELKAYTFIVSLFFIIGLIPLLFVLCGYGQKQVKQYLKTAPSREVAQEKLDNFLQSTQAKNGLRYNRDFLCGVYGGITVFIETAKIARVYTETNTIVTYKHIPLKERCVIIGLKNGTKQSINVRSLETAKEQLRDFQQLCPDIAIGYFPKSHK